MSPFNIHSDYPNRNSGWLEKPTSPRKKLMKFFLFVGIFLIVATIVFSVKVIFSYENAYQTDDEAEKFSFFTQIKDLFSSYTTTLKGENDDRINILIMGIGGPGHNGPYLSDTMMIASYNPATNQTSLLSVPRDLAAPIPGHGWRKINEASAYGQEQNSKNGGELARQVVSDLFGIDIPYYIRVDFTAVEKLVDDLGGVKIYVDNSFRDAEYPTSNDGTTVVEFHKGWQMMSGKTALEYARSRHGNNGEGSDFARAKRQQKIIIALKNQVLSASTLVNPRQINNLLNNFSEHIATNMDLGESVRLAKMVREVNTETITHYVLQDDPQGELESYLDSAGTYLLQPKNGDYNILKEIAKNLFTIGESKAPIQEQITATTEIIEIKNEDCNVIVLNGTSTAGLASSTAELLKTLNFTVSKIGNAPTRDYTQNIIYDLSGGKKANSVKKLQTELEAIVALETPDWVTQLANSPDADLQSPPDVVLVVGKK